MPVTAWVPVQIACLRTGSIYRKPVWRRLHASLAILIDHLCIFNIPSVPTGVQCGS